MTFLNRQIRFIASVKRKVLVGLMLGVFLSFIIIFLEPFDTDQFHSDHKLLVLSIFGILIFSAFVIYSSLENLWYFRVRKVWRVSHEIISTILFFLFSGSMIYLYNGLLINQQSYSLGSHLRYLGTIVLLMIPVIAPVMLYLRQQFGELILPLASNSIRLIGENKHEILTLEKKNLLFVKAFENYVEICFVDESNKVVSKTFRQTLSNVSQQIPSLEKCHRSYLVNLITVKEIIGNSQSAKIAFVQGEKEIPLSKTYYKQIKNRMV
ncbi:LytTR family DNA-binding domain-containing protein [Fluviicola taffensis]|uniref:LytTr DNA-binding region n=1 Tax=Fluviicola taffensis (strain DSM 16823 / NCIMB 13979 / RW262) TaxID=755732 RepID=F2I960_FLUTR|nr:LytTR family DNA-binding domain-containing protein [Fluviicola taffensis]AEA43007.1 LytTr DNA-binding region [Fluviicola taffensis DSM 16823]